MTVLECLGSDGYRGRNEKEHYIEKFQKPLSIAMGHIVGSSYKFVQEWEPDTFLIHQTTLNV